MATHAIDVLPGAPFGMTSNAIGVFDVVGRKVGTGSLVSAVRCESTHRGRDRPGALAEPSPPAVVPSPTQIRLLVVSTTHSAAAGVKAAT